MRSPRASGHGDPKQQSGRDLSGDRRRKVVADGDGWDDRQVDDLALEDTTDPGTNVPDVGCPGGEGLVFHGGEHLSRRSCRGPHGVDRIAGGASAPGRVGEEGWIQGHEGLRVEDRGLRLTSRVAQTAGQGVELAPGLGGGHPDRVLGTLVRVRSFGGGLHRPLGGVEPPHRTDRNSRRSGDAYEPNVAGHASSTSPRPLANRSWRTVIASSSSGPSAVSRTM